MSSQNYGRYLNRSHPSEDSENKYIDVSNYLTTEMDEVIPISKSISISSSPPLILSSSALPSSNFAVVLFSFVCVTLMTMVMS